VGIPGEEGGDQVSYGFRVQAGALKEAVPLATYAGSLTELRQVGDRLLGLCPLHEEKTPSFNVYPDGHYHCYGCEANGDLIDLYAAAEGCSEPWEALVGLSVLYGVELPNPRTEAWSKAQDRKAAYLDAAYRTMGGVLCRRTYRTLILPFVDATADAEERERALEETWAAWQTAMDWGLMAEGVCNGREDLVLALAKVYAEAKAVSA
jgi:hypothetical protein